MPRRPLAMSVVSVLLLATAACGGGSGSSEKADTASDTKALAGVSVDGEVGTGLEVKLDKPVKTDGVKSEVLTTGDGDPVKANEVALLQLYIGNGTSGQKAVNTYDAGPPVQVTMSEGQLFQVLLDAVVGEPAGSRVAITAPASDVWGAQGAPQLKIGPDDTAVFVADIVSVPPTEVLDGPEGKQLEPPADAPTVIEKDGAVTGFDWSTAPEKAPQKLTVIPLIEGEGPPARAGSMVTFDYFGSVYGSKKPFDESYSREPAAFGVGVGGLIPAWDKSIPGLKRGSRVLIIAPPGEAYGDQPREGIPANSTLVFVVDVLGVS
ncbi:FKBP-type peptidyl-prolyl cis-trans isomerase [Nocardioides mesophilus]|uniref:Peptidyl-prolyl cis-trans isomerase n=1 Tax=Nocardioides mesophilus TaxID=433659 RepID=A0A7G9RAX1_9ACTN|nr:FKBP-type peptidyl-prolyl cis-trans isomerase [Nocardioides mesophilus]QNN52746.1 FKBP-type peptidyl-prolyl cis-trans isomerase [Nocardioides mesophilus]